MSSLHDVLDTVIDYIPGMPQNVKDWARGAVSADRPADGGSDQGGAQSPAGRQDGPDSGNPSDSPRSSEAASQDRSEPQPTPVVAMPQQREADGGPAPLQR